MAIHDECVHFGSEKLHSWRVQFLTERKILPGRMEVKSFLLVLKRMSNISFTLCSKQKEVFSFWFIEEKGQKLQTKRAYVKFAMQKKS